MRDGFDSYVDEIWNKFDLAMYIMLLVAIILRLTLTSDDYFMYARYVYVVDLIFFFMRVQQLYIANRNLGPKVIMIQRMVCVSGPSEIIERFRFSFLYLFIFHFFVSDVNTTFCPDQDQDIFMQCQMV